MYPHVTQFESRREERQRERRLVQDRRQSDAGRPLPRAVMARRGPSIGRRAWLGWLPRGERRTIARLLDAFDVPAGRPLVRQGAEPEDFFLIERGRAAVLRDGWPIAELGPGDFFGGIALLQGTTRTTSVVATTRMRIRFAPRDQFAALMRTFPTLASVVRTTEQERLVVSHAGGRSV
jgi:CRP-like cAMP-binding protein